MNVRTSEDIFLMPLSLKESENKNRSRIGRNLYLPWFYADFREEVQKERRQNMRRSSKHDPLVDEEDDDTASYDSTDSVSRAEPC